jgi:hypothetical protein
MEAGVEEGEPAAGPNLSERSNRTSRKHLFVSVRL